MKLDKSDIYLPNVTKATFKKVGRKTYHIKKYKISTNVKIFFK